MNVTYGVSEDWISNILGQENKFPCWFLLGFIGSIHFKFYFL